jgi:hypothetical protein
MLHEEKSGNPALKHNLLRVFKASKEQLAKQKRSHKRNVAASVVLVRVTRLGDFG